MTNCADFFAQNPFSTEISNHNFFSVYFLHVWGVKTAIFYEFFSKTDLGEQRGFGGAIGRIMLPQI